jgi:hypothetical protein
MQRQVCKVLGMRYNGNRVEIDFATLREIGCIST